ncbi:MAG: SURF1 family protein [Betaproteobacteria bacterium]
MKPVDHPGPSLPRSGRWWLLTLATWAMIALTFSLGRWQMSRADYKLALAAAMQARMREPALDPASLLAQPDLASQLHRSVQLQGRWLADRTVYLDNRPMGARAGFWVLTPLQLEGSSQAVLVQRGWIARDFIDRQRLAPVQTPAGSVQVSGRLALAPGKLYQLGPDAAGLIRQNLDLAQFRSETGLPLLNALVIQTGAPSDGLQRSWDPPQLGVDKHHGYAFQWFGLSGLLVVLYIWFQWIAPRRRNNRL